ncbi:hypothetical protein NEOC65_000341 [Neochlamydia sp. AcF65]|nr:hypothetical protein [Neochlamydia sp. AcF65]
MQNLWIDALTDVFSLIGKKPKNDLFIGFFKGKSLDESLLCLLESIGLKLGLLLLD